MNIPLKATGHTLSYGRSENFDHVLSASDVGTFIKCTYKYGEDLGVKYLVPKAICDYSSMNIP